MGERRLQRGRTALEQAKRLLETGDVRGAVEPLERARADFAAELDLGAVRTVREAAERGYHQAAEADEPFYEQLLYAAAQNIRFLSRREAAQKGVPWEDPHPELDLPGRPEIRIERGVGRRAKIWIAVVGIAVALAAAGIGIAIAVSYETAYVVNDTGHLVGYGDCNSVDGTTSELLSGERLRLSGWNLCVEIYDNVRFTRGCIHLHDGETANVSDAKPCD